MKNLGNLENSIAKAEEVLRELFVRKDEISAREHCLRVARLARKFGEYLLTLPQYQEILTNHDLLRLYLAGLIHDWGKDKIKVWKKPGAFSKAERELMENHSQKSVDIAYFKNVTRDWAVMISVRDHHRYENGGGYPKVISDKLLLCKILSIVDAYDAMVHPRIYGKEKSQEEAIAELIRCKGTQFHAELVDQFVIFIGGNACRD